MAARGSVRSCLVYLFIHLVTQVTLDTAVPLYNLYIRIQLIIFGHLTNKI